MAVGRRTRRTAMLAHAMRQASGQAPPGSPSVWARVRAVPRLIAAVRSGEYTAVTSTRLLMVLAGIGYVVSPIDVVPEGLLLVFGIVDDVLVLGWVVTELMRETEQFIAWEGQQAEQARGAGHAQQWSEQAVPSYVVHD